MVARVAAEREAMLQRERRFFANVTHDLMTPLTIARGHVEVLRRAHRGASPDLEETCAVVLDELGRMEGLVEDLLLIGQLDTPDRITNVQLDAQAFLEEAAAPRADARQQLEHRPRSARRDLRRPDRHRARDREPPRQRHRALAA